MTALPITIDQLVQYGVLGVVLAWFMFRAEKKLDSVSGELKEVVISMKELVQELKALRATSH